MTEDILKIADIVDDPNAPEWVECPDLPGFKVLLRIPDIPENIRIAVRAMKSDPESQGADFHYLLLKSALSDWQGLKVGDLGKLLKTKVKVEGSQAGTPAPPAEAELAFCPENLDFLLRKSQPFFKWASEMVKAKEEVLAQQEEADSKN